MTGSNVENLSAEFLGIPASNSKNRTSSTTNEISGVEISSEDVENASSSSDSDEEEESINPMDASQRRRLQNAKFNVLLSKRAVTDPVATNKRVAPDLPDAQLSTAHLIVKHDLATGTLDPRDYQVELFERAKAQNTIAVLETGSGKTLIAVLLLRHTLQNELNDRAQDKPHRISFFLVDSVALAFQQAAVLRHNLDQSVGQFFGAMGTDLWNKEIWDEHFKTNMVIVCTAEILHQCLLNSYIRMDQINLLIFDEAHHTKKDHPYARIIRDTYLKEVPSKRPRIFGMTASPVDTKGDVVDAAMRLETLLDSTIATTSQATLLRQYVSRPVEETWEYTILEPPVATALYKDLKQRFGDLECLEGIFKFAWQATSELGSWCSDRAWLRALADDVLPRLEGKINKSVESNSSLIESRDTHTQILRIREASDLVKRHELTSPLGPGALSSKVQLLRAELQKRFLHPDQTKCIVFTEKRYTALMLFELFNNLCIPFLRPGVLIGVRSGDVAGMGITFRQQFLTLIKFREGEINCLFATSVAEEGLDIPDCNLVVRFDLYQTLIQYVQSRGRARHYRSTYAIMVEKYNPQHQGRLSEVRDAESIMQQFCEALPENRLLHGNDDLEKVLEKEAGKRTFTIQASGAKLTYHSAIAILARYASSLQYEKEQDAKVHYVVLPVNNAFVCEVILPEKSPVVGLTGSPEIRKSRAMQSAAFDTCIRLRKAGLLDNHFKSMFHRRLPAMRNAKLAITSKQTSQYDMIVKPSFWEDKRGERPSSLYITVVLLEPSGPLTRQHASLLLLTRNPLPEFPAFPIYLDEDIETIVHLAPLKEQLTISKMELQYLTTFFLRVFGDIFHKTYDYQPERMTYWLGPTHIQVIPDRDTNPRDLIDWKTVIHVYKNETLPVPSNANPNYLLDRLVFDNWNGACRYFTLAVEKTLHPSDPPPPFVARRRYMNDIMNYSTSLSKNSRAKFLSGCDWNQPVLKAELVRLRRNLLDKMTDAERDVETRCYICVEPLKISAIPASVAASCLAFPAIISRMNSYLITLEACAGLDLTIKLEFALEALTKDSDNTEEHRAQQLHVQRGMGKNYERLEFLGDCFLKMATSIALFSQNPDDDEFDYHVSRMCLVCNRNLFNTAVQKELYKYIRTQGFSRHTWYPDGLSLLRGKDHSKQMSSESKHALGEKTIADVCEALIGASLLTGGPRHRFDMAVKAVTALVDDASHKVTSWRDYQSLYSMPRYQVQTPDGFELDLVRQVEEKLGYSFKYPRLLRSAFTHPSLPSAWAKVPCYQRLEFLGDALLDMVCVENIFHRFPDRDPQWLTEHKMAMVSNKYLGALAVKLGLHTHLKHFSNPLQSQITLYAQAIQIAESDSKGAVDYWVDANDPPKCLPDMVEAYLGAIFVDSSFDFEVVEDFFRRFIQPYFEDMAIYDTFANKHPTTFLHNRLGNEYGCLNYCLKAGELPGADGTQASVLAAVFVHDVVIAEGMSSSSRYAKVKASERALAALGGMTRLEFRKKYNCDCRVVCDAADQEIGTAI
ncbi:putative RNA helicase/RNAse III [Aspergillus fijiensis CBS 313.89]|uniref:Dicer-like protein 1 n=1 Tax=Aspergillus fijiensis CBS 313.89 TaxID=1448319 RepID=A0A8G1RVS5_9EURO|nr:dicer-like protein 1 [Aspergillus fijiensis CBS 313.89]RAK79873.1 dicer-like protein 1 [Aspergillus fijiensis CBS 313.89]